MNRTVAFIALSLVAIALFVIGRQLEGDFLKDLWSQLFILTIGTLTTTFVLEALLRHGADKRQRSRNAFAFRTFSANVLNALHEIVDLKRANETLFEAALCGDKEFEAAAADVASSVERSKGFEPNAYNKHYLNMANGLREFSKQYIRLFSSSRQDMLKQYRELNELADHWNYVAEFRESERAYVAKLDPGNPDKLPQEAAYRDKAAAARDLAVTTAKTVATLVAKHAKGQSFYE